MMAKVMNSAWFCWEPPPGDRAVPAVRGRPRPWHHAAGRAGASPGPSCLPPGCASGLGLQSQRPEQGAARGTLLDRFEELVQAPASLAEQVTGLVEEGCTVLGRHCLQ